MKPLLQKYSLSLLKTVPKFIRKIYIKSGEIVIYTNDNYILELITFLKYNTYSRFTTFSDICAVDYPMKNPRFEVVYNLLSVFYSNRVRIKIEADQFTFVPSLTKIFPGANWYEREIWDMFGIGFDSHPDLRRILTDYGFDGFPLRKDFPLSGFVEVRYSETKKKIVFEPVQLAQEYRSFDFLTTWPLEQKLKKMHS